MPLMQGKSQQTIASNIAELHRANKGKDKPRSNEQIAAIAYSVAKRK